MTGKYSQSSAQPSKRSISKSRQETTDNYEAVLSILDQRHRVIICRDGIQWIIQRRKRGGAARPWRALGYYTTRTSLIRACATLCREIDPNVMSLLLVLPDVIGRTA